MSHYDVLGVRPSADQATVRRAYLDLARRHHPDHAGGDVARMRAINDAWATLGDPVRRAAYDLALSMPVSSASPTAGRPSSRDGRDPRYDPSDDLDVDPDAYWLDDDRPLRMTVVLPRWLRLVPLATFAASVATFWGGVILMSEPVVALGWMLLILSGAFFLSAPFVALLASRRASRPTDDD